MTELNLTDNTDGDGINTTDDTNLVNSDYKNPVYRILLQGIIPQLTVGNGDGTTNSTTVKITVEEDTGMNETNDSETIDG